MKNLLFILLLLVTGTFAFSQTKEAVNHNIFAKINPETSEITVTDSIQIDGEFNNKFLLNSNLVPVSLSKEVSLKKITEEADATDVGMDRDDTNGGMALKLSKWKILGSAQEFVISYSGIIKSEIKQSEENYQRGFAESPGIISNTGVYLAGSTFWVPVFEDKLMTFSLTTELPKDWKNVSQGKRIYDKSFKNKHIDTWVCNNAQEEIFLIAARFTEYSHKMNCGLDAMAFLRSPDEALANKYLEVTEQYMDMYQSMLGDYPYTKFALVENFWETGYGMPSFTLLGEKVIRFPFILHSSYPHELLHNWWGNSVYVDFNSGNWCEGITVFMADHLIKEQRGAGDEYRRSTLQKFSNFVNPENDFPVRKFISRHDGPSEAIGYGKSMMMWQMLRRKLGDELFLKGMKLFYTNNKYKEASFSDIRKSMETVSGIDLKFFFDQWVDRKGAPELNINKIETRLYAGKYNLTLAIEQTQEEEAFIIDIPVNIATKNGLETFVFSMDKKHQEYQINLSAKPLKLVVDPQYDVFRVLNPAEVPPTLSKIWGSKNNLIILPAKATKMQMKMYESFADKWQQTDSDNFDIVFDTEIEDLPKDKTAWILGFENKFANKINSQLENYNSGFTSDSVIYEKKNLNKKSNSFVFTLFDENDLNKQSIFISIDNKNAVNGLLRKLPHYGKYSYLAFSGEEPTNIAKGQWPILNSPLVKTFKKGAEKLSVSEERSALAYLKPVFSENRMMSTIKYLASEELKGRGLGTPEIDMAAEYIAMKFEKAGLKPMSEDYFQKFTHKFDDMGEIELTNVIGVIPGTDPKLKEEAVVISAHYDHLGYGWPDVRKGNKGKIHFGADDNASGVSIIIELAETMAKTAKPKRTIVFLACTAEEAGLIGSRYFVAHSKDYLDGEIFANINLDTDGSLFDKKLLVLNANSAKEWKFIFMGTDYTTGVKSEVIDKGLDASDQLAFIEKGIPAVQLFTGATENYHRPSDTYEKIDGKGLVKVAIVSKEVLTYLAGRENPMNYTGQAQDTKKPSVKMKTSRKVSTGSVPDFAFKGKGVKIGSVISNSAGEKAGLQAGDIILALDGVDVDGLRTYSVLLKKYKPNDLVILNILRNEKEMKISLVLEER